MKYAVFIIAFIFCSCGNNYETEEQQAINDIANDYLVQEHLNELLDPSFPWPKNIKVTKATIDTMDLKVVISDTLTSLGKILTKRQFLYDNNQYKEQNRDKLKEILNMHQFSNLPTKEIEFDDLSLTKPYRKVRKQQVKEDIPFIMLKFSRICFDEKMENGLLVMNLGIDVNGKSKRYGFYGKYHDRSPLTLIKKVGDKWKIVEQ